MPLVKHTQIAAEPLGRSEDPSCDCTEAQTIKVSLLLVHWDHTTPAST